MGWARMLLLGDWGQQLDIDDARSQLDGMRRSATFGAVKDLEQDEQLERLADHNEQLTLCLITLTRLLVSKGVVSPAEVQELLAVLDPPPPPTPEANEEPTNDDLIALADAARRLKR